MGPLLETATPDPLVKSRRPRWLGSPSSDAANIGTGTPWGIILACRKSNL